MSLNAIICILSACAASAFAKNFGEVSDCLHARLVHCKDQCINHIPDAARRETIGECFFSDAHETRRDIHTCLSAKGIEREQACFRIDHAQHARSMAAGALKLRQEVRNALKETAICFKNCLQESQTEIAACQEGCGEADDETKQKLKDCSAAARARFPSDTLKTCLNEALGLD